MRACRDVEKVSKQSPLLDGARVEGSTKSYISQRYPGMVVSRDCACFSI